jgi:hypothetical protein
MRSAKIRRDAAVATCHTRHVLFDEPSAQLPTATLRPIALQARRRAVIVHLDQWLSIRWNWLRPRMVPLMAAFVGLLLTLGVVKYAGLLASDAGQLRMRPRAYDARSYRHAHQRHVLLERDRNGRALIRIVIQPLPGDGEKYVELTLEPPDPQ